MAGPHDIPADKSVLLDLINTSRRMQSRLLEAGAKRGVQLQPTPPRIRTTTAQLTLPYPHSLVSKIRHSGLPESVVSRLTARIAQWHQDTRQSLQNEYEKAHSHLSMVPRVSSASPEEELQPVYKSLYNEKILPNLEKSIMDIVGNALSKQKSIVLHNAKQKMPFNHECLPLLETYFEYNAYPSSQDRALLARKTTMCARQIEVWFQNHRRRAKKEGHQLKRLSRDPLPRELNLDYLNASMAQSPVQKDGPKVEALEVPLATPSVIILTPTEVGQAVDTLCVLVPAHAFPTKYAPIPDHTSCLLSVKNWSFPPPDWPRRASAKVLRKTSTTPDELAVELQKKLSIAGSDTVKRSHTPSSAWYPIVTAPLTAPLFALIRKPSLPVSQSKPTTRESPSPQSLRRKSSTLTNNKRPSPYQPRRLKQKLLSRTPSNSSLCSISSSSDESEIWTPSPSPLPRYISLFKETSIFPPYPDWDAYLMPP